MRPEMPAPVKSMRFRAECQDCEDGDMEGVSIAVNGGRTVEAKRQRGTNWWMEHWAWGVDGAGWRAQKASSRQATGLDCRHSPIRGFSSGLGPPPSMYTHNVQGSVSHSCWCTTVGLSKKASQKSPPRGIEGGKTDDDDREYHQNNKGSESTLISCTKLHF
jgi:hypothetical protein